METLELRNFKEVNVYYQKELMPEFHKHWENQKIDDLEKQIQALNEITDKENFWEEKKKAQKTLQTLVHLKKKFELWQQLQASLKDFTEMQAMIQEEYDLENALELINSELSQIRDKLDEVLITQALSNQDDETNAIININPGAGGTESQDWASLILRMYTKWATARNFSITVLDLQPGDEAGIKSASLLIEGSYAYGHLKAENGIHRLVRISPFDSGKRRHTSFCAVHIIPEVNEDIEIEINDQDLRIDTYRASGAGGQHVNKTDSAIRITHLPTNVVVQCQNERSQYKNKLTAMGILKSRLYELEKKKQVKDLEERSGEKKGVSWGNQIRSYVMHPYKMVKDLRTNHKTSDVNSVMDGDLDPFINSYLKSLSYV